MSGSRALAIAHRAGNDLATLRAAEAAGADLVEADVWSYRGRLEIRHLKTMGPVPLLWDRWKLASARGPRLLIADILAAARPSTQFMFDLKGTDAELPRALIEAIRASGRAGPYTVCSQRWELLRPFDEIADACVAASIGGPRQLRRAWGRLADDDRRIVSIHFKLLDAETVQRLKQRARGVITWPINTPERLEKVLAWGVDGFTSDNLEVVRQYAAAAAASA